MAKNNENKIGSELKACLGLLKKDKESDTVKKSLEKRWKKWTYSYSHLPDKQSKK